MRDVIMTIIFLLLILATWVLGLMVLSPSHPSVTDDRPVWLDHATVTTTYIGDSEINMCITVPRAALTQDEVRALLLGESSKNGEMLKPTNDF